MAKYIDAEKLKAHIQYLIKKDNYELFDVPELLSFIDSHQQEQPDFPITDEQIKEFLDTHPKIEVPEKYKNPDWLWKKQEQPEVDLEKEIEHFLSNATMMNKGEWKGKYPISEMGFEVVARHFYSLGLITRKV